jgi:hypothetical protein
VKFIALFSELRRLSWPQSFKPSLKQVPNTEEFVREHPEVRKTKQSPTLGTNGFKGTRSSKLLRLRFPTTFRTALPGAHAYNLDSVPTTNKRLEALNTEIAESE